LAHIFSKTLYPVRASYFLTHAADFYFKQSTNITHDLE